MMPGNQITAVLIINYSRGRSKYDNAPEQCQATSFDKFEEVVLADRSVKKGMAYICAPLDSGIHYQKPGEYPGVNHWRLANYAKPRAFLPFDFDGFASPAEYAATCEYLNCYRGFGYTTASHTAEKPRARAILQASRPVTRSEGIKVCEAIQADIQAQIGVDAVKFDSSVYRGEQPIYTPVITSVVFRFGGEVVDVDEVLASLPSTEAKAPQQSQRIDEGFFLPDTITDGEGREDTILRYAGQLRSKGHEQSSIERILLDYNQLHIKPPLDDTVVLDRARRYQATIQASVDENPFLDLSECRAERFFGKEAPAQRWLIKDLLPAGIAGIIVAPGGTGKSWFLLQISASVAAGIPLAGCWEVE